MPLQFSFLGPRPAFLQSPRLGELWTVFPPLPTLDTAEGGVSSISGPGGLKWNCSQLLISMLLTVNVNPKHLLDPEATALTPFPSLDPRT